MTDLQLRNGLMYVLIWVAVTLAGPLGLAVGSGTVPGFRDGEPLVSARGEIAGALTLLMTIGGVWMAANRPRLGSEEIAADVDRQRKAGASRRALTVRRKTEPSAVPTVAQVADALEPRMKASTNREGS